MNSQILILLLVISGAALVMLAVNLYVLLRSRRNKEEAGQLTVLHQRLDSFSQLINDQLERSRQSTERATLTVHQQVQSFTQNMTQLQEQIKYVQDSVKNVVSFQDIFKSPKLRGNWGEASLEAALTQYFPRDIYALQHHFNSGEAVDAILRLPNELILPIDSKFNWENFQKMTGADNDINRETYFKLFCTDVKKKIDEIAAKYILPSEGTTDFALMYVPAETVYYEIINNIKDVDLSGYARTKKVQLVSPNTFYLSVGAIMHWFRDVQLSKQTKEIMKRLDRIATDGGKLADDFRRLGKHISDASSSYNESEKRLTLMVDRVKNVIEIGQKEDLPAQAGAPKIEPPTV